MLGTRFHVVQACCMCNVTRSKIALDLINSFWDRKERCWIQCMSVCMQTASPAGPSGKASSEPMQHFALELQESSQQPAGPFICQQHQAAHCRSPQMGPFCSHCWSKLAHFCLHAADVSLDKLAAERGRLHKALWGLSCGLDGGSKWNQMKNTSCVVHWVSRLAHSSGAWANRWKAGVGLLLPGVTEGGDGSGWWKSGALQALLFSEGKSTELGKVRWFCSVVELNCFTAA